MGAGVPHASLHGFLRSHLEPLAVARERLLGPLEGLQSGALAKERLRQGDHLLLLRVSAGGLVLPQPLLAAQAIRQGLMGTDEKRWEQGHPRADEARAWCAYR
eukprot:1194279-Prorocentrum_minimum.AAC.7